MPLLDQSVFRKMGRSGLKWARTGSLVIARFKCFKLVDEVGGPYVCRDWLVQVGARKGAKFMDLLFVMRNEAAVKTSEATEGTEGITGARKGPIANKVEFGACGGVAIGVHVVAHPFESVEEEVTFLEVEGQAVFDVDFAETAEPTED